MLENFNFDEIHIDKMTGPYYDSKQPNIIVLRHR